MGEEAVGGIAGGSSSRSVVNGIHMVWFSFGYRTSTYPGRRDAGPTTPGTLNRVA